MNRRGFFSRMLAVPAVIGLMPEPRLPVSGNAIRQRYGAVTVQRHWELAAQGIHLHVLYNGKDVTRDCMFADDTNEGMAELMVLDHEGKPFIDRATDRIAKQIVYGVELREGAPLNG